MSKWGRTMKGFIRIQFFILLLILFSSLSANAGGYYIYGEGQRSCGTWVFQRENNSFSPKGDWMLGAISAVGYYDVRDLKEADVDAMFVWIDNYCQDHPLKDFGQAVYALIERLAIK